MMRGDAAAHMWGRRSMESIIGALLAGGALWLQYETLQPLAALCIAALLAQLLSLLRTAQKQRETIAALRICSERDPLTRLNNRNAFAAAAHALEESSCAATVLVCDIDGLKWVNDTLGHLAGDRVIRQAADVLRQCCPDDAQLFRMGGDEFLALIPRRLESAEVVWLSETLRDASVQHEHLRLSIGLATMMQADRLKEAISCADAAMYQNRREKYAAKEIETEQEGERCFAGRIERKRH